LALQQTYQILINPLTPTPAETGRKHRYCFEKF